MVLLGHVGTLLFERTKFSDVLLLVLFGALLNLFFDLRRVNLSGAPAVESFAALAPYVGAIALITILFDGGLALKLKDLFTSLGPATLLTVVGFVLCALFVAVVAVALLDVSFGLGLLLGAIVGGSCSSIVMPLVPQARMARNTRTLLSLESALTDVLCVIVALTLAEVLSGRAGGPGLAQTGAAVRGIVTQFSIAILLGLLAGTLWIRLRPHVAATEKEYVLTIAALFALYAGVQALGGSGAIAVLVFGIVLGNSRRIAETLRIEGAPLSRTMVRFHAEITFFVRTFFFVYLGLILDLSDFREPSFLLAAFALFAAILASRWASVQVLAPREPSLAKDRKLVLYLIPRGLAAAVLAALPSSPPYNIPGSGVFVAYTFALILLTNVVATGAVLLFGRGSASRVRTEATPP